MVHGPNARSQTVGAFPEPGNMFPLTSTSNLPGKMSRPRHFSGRRLRTVRHVGNRKSQIDNWKILDRRWPEVECRLPRREHTVLENSPSTAVRSFRTGLLTLTLSSLVASGGEGIPLAQRAREHFRFDFVPAGFRMPEARESGIISGRLHRMDRGSTGDWDNPDGVAGKFANVRASFLW